MFNTIEDYINAISREPSQVEDGDGYQYIKAYVLRKQLLEIYDGHHKFELTQDTFNSKGMFGRGLLWYRHPISGEWLYQSGTASLPYYKGLRLDYPAFETLVFKNACKKIGNYFGMNLNQDGEDVERALDKAKGEEEAGSVGSILEIEVERLAELIENAKTEAELMSYKQYIPRGHNGLNKKFVKRLDYFVNKSGK